MLNRSFEVGGSKYNFVFYTISCSLEPSKFVFQNETQALKKKKTINNVYSLNVGNNLALVMTNNSLKYTS